MAYFKIDNIKESIQVLKLDQSAISKVAADKSATVVGVVILVVPVLLNLIFSSLLFPSGFGAIFQRFVFWSMVVPFLALVGATFAVVFLMNKLYKVNPEYPEFFRIISHAAIILWLSFLPFLIDFIGIFASGGLYNILWFGGLAWIFVVAYKVFNSRYHQNAQNSAILVGAFVLIYLLVQNILGQLLVGSYYNIF